MREGKIDSTHDFTARGLGELRAWLEPWFRVKSPKPPSALAKDPQQVIGGIQWTDLVQDGAWHWFGAVAGSYAESPAVLIDPADFGPKRTFTQVKFDGQIYATAGNGCTSWSISLGLVRFGIDTDMNNPLWSGGTHTLPTVFGVAYAFGSGWITLQTPPSGNIPALGGILYQFNYLVGAPTPPYLGLALSIR